MTEINGHYVTPSQMRAVSSHFNLGKSLLVVLKWFDIDRLFGFYALWQSVVIMIGYLRFESVYQIVIEQYSIDIATLSIMFLIAAAILIKHGIKTPLTLYVICLTPVIIFSISGLLFTSIGIDGLDGVRFGENLLILVILVRQILIKLFLFFVEEAG